LGIPTPMAETAIWGESVGRAQGGAAPPKHDREPRVPVGDG